MKFLAALSLKTRLLAIICFLGGIPLVGAALTYVALGNSRDAQSALDAANQGTIHLANINGDVFEIVMESRGIYMSRDWKAAEPFAKRLIDALSKMRMSAEKWRAAAVDGEQENIRALSAEIEKFAQFRIELVRLAREDSTAAARLYGDNDINRTARAKLNDRLVELATRYQSYSARAYEGIERTQRANILLLGVLSAIGVAALAGGLWMVLRSLVGPLRRLERIMRGLAVGSIHEAVDGTGRRDEIGEMARAVEVLRLNSVEREQLEAAVAKTRDREIAHQIQLEEAAATFRKAISTIIAALNQEIAQTRTSAEVLTNTADNVTRQAETAARSSEGAAGSSETVAAATEELSSSIKEISNQANRVSSIVAETANDARRTDKDVAGLTSAAERIGTVVELIRTIAEQTNLLALNATIKSARAGEAGRGFAVVASEVKALATQTAKATDDIALQISGVQSSTETAVSSIRAIAGKIDQINTLSAGIATSVQQQESATQEIARNISLASDGSRSAAANVAAVSDSAKATKGESESILSVSGELASVAQQLGAAVDVFMRGITEDLRDRRIAVRRQTDRVVIAIDGDRREETHAIDLSLTGIKIKLVAGLAKGATTHIDLGNGPIAATVVWVHEFRSRPALRGSTDGDSAWLRRCRRRAQ